MAEARRLQMHDVAGGSTAGMSLLRDKLESDCNMRRLLGGACVLKTLIQIIVGNVPAEEESAYGLVKKALGLRKGELSFNLFDAYCHFRRLAGRDTVSGSIMAKTIGNSARNLQEALDLNKVSRQQQSSDMEKILPIIVGKIVAEVGVAMRRGEVLSTDTLPSDATKWLKESYYPLATGLYRDLLSSRASEGGEGKMGKGPGSKGAKGGGGEGGGKGGEGAGGGMSGKGWSGIDMEGGEGARGGKGGTTDKKRPPCYSFDGSPGSCSYAESCRFFHDPNATSRPACVEYMKTGACQRGDECKLLHADQPALVLKAAKRR